MNLERIVSQGISANDRTKPEEAIVQILKDGKVEETKTAQKYGNFVRFAIAHLQAPRMMPSMDLSRLKLDCLDGSWYLMYYYTSPNEHFYYSMKFNPS